MELTKSMVELAKNAVKFLERGKLHDFGDLLDQGWQIKKKLSDNISTPEIDEMYERAMNNGGLGGKLLGAGGGGYLLIYAPEKNKGRLIESMKEYPLMQFKFSKTGSTIEVI